MPTTLTSFADAEIRMRYREPFLTEGLDYKLAVNTPPGVYRGFRLVPNGSALTVGVASDINFSDHSAVYQDALGHSLTIRRTGGDFFLDLSAFINKTVVLAVYATYAVGSETTAEIRVYELIPSDEFSVAAERPQLVVLGTVVVPGSGIIPDANITMDRRTSAWMATAPEATFWHPVIQNGSFEWAHNLQSYRHAAANWELVTTSGGVWRPSDSFAGHSGSKALQLNVTAAPVTASAIQHVGLPVLSGQLVRVNAWVRSLAAPTVAANISIVLNWADVTGAVTSSSSVVLVVVGATDGSYRLVDSVVTIPPSVDVLMSVEIKANAQNYATTGVVLLVDDVQVFVETAPPSTRPNDLRAGTPRVASLVYEDFSNPASLFSQIAGLSVFDKTTPASEGTLVFERKDQDYTGGKLPPAAAFYGRLVSLGLKLLGSAADARKARLSTPYHTTFDATLIWESTPTPGTTPSVRLYVSLSGLLLLTINASYDGTNWNKDSAGSLATLFMMRRGVIETYFREADAAWSTWTQINRMAGPSTTTTVFEALLAHYDAGGNRRNTVDHLGLPGHHIIDYCQPWLTGNSSGPINPEGWTFASVGTGNVQTLANGNVSIPLRLSFTTGNTAGDESRIYTNNYIAQSYPSVDNIPLDNIVIVLEWSAMNIAFTNEPNFMCGFGDIPGGSQSGFFFQKNTADTNWKVYLRSSAGNSSIIDTGVPPGAPATADHLFFRLEMYGTNQPGGKRFLAYIDNALVASFTGADVNLPTEPMRAVFRMFVSGTNGNNYFLGAVRWRCTERLTDGLI